MDCRWWFYSNNLVAKISTFCFAVKFTKMKWHGHYNALTGKITNYWSVQCRVLTDWTEIRYCGKLTNADFEDTWSRGTVVKVRQSCRAEVLMRLWAVLKEIPSGKVNCYTAYAALFLGLQYLHFKVVLVTACWVRSGSGRSLGSSVSHCCCARSGRKLGGWAIQGCTVVVVTARHSTPKPWKHMFVPQANP